MKLWIVIYLTGRIVGSVGPLPYDERECERRAAEKVAGMRHDVVTPQGYTSKDVALKCEWHAERPKMKDLQP